MNILLIALVSGTVLLHIVWCVIRFRSEIIRLSNAFINLPQSHKVALFLGITIATACAQKDTTNTPQRTKRPLQAPAVSATNSAPQYSPDDSARGYRLESVVTNSDISYAMPEGANVAGTWHLTGAYEDVQRVQLGDNVFKFPIGNHLVDSVWMYTCGRIRPQLKNASNEIVAVGSPMTAIPNESRLWTSITSSRSRLLTWENFAQGRISKDNEGDLPGTNSPTRVSAQVELFANGDFITRSNEVARVYRRNIACNPISDINPPSRENPLISAHPYGPVQDLSVIDSEAAYCWVEIEVDQADAWVRFDGDHPSNLADPCFAAKAGETYRVTILIGKTYRVTCDVPFNIVGKSEGAIEVNWEDAQTAIVKRPIEFVIRKLQESGTPGLLSAANTGGLSGFSVFVLPTGIGGYLSWTKGCCLSTDNGRDFFNDCGVECSCGGCTASGYYYYEGYGVPVLGGRCPCGSPPKEPDKESYPGSVFVNFTNPVVIFEDEYLETPTEKVSLRSTETTLRIIADGGDRGGVLYVTADGIENKLSGGSNIVPIYRNLAAGETINLSNIYTAIGKSQTADDIKVTAIFTENDTGWTDSSQATATAVKIKLEAVAIALDNPSEERHKYGVGESIRLRQQPTNPKISWRVVGGNMTSSDEYCCPLIACTNPLIASCRGVEYVPNISVIAPSYVEVWDRGYTDFNAPVGEAGCIALILKYTIGPFDVSFTGIAVEEVPDNNGTAGGYFDREQWISWRHHSRENGAGTWFDVTDGNVMGDQYFVDQAGIKTILPRVNSSGLIDHNPTNKWSDGWMHIPNPFGWNAHGTKGLSDPVGTFVEDTVDLIELSADGTCRIEKFGNFVIRYTTGKVYLNGLNVK